MQSLLHHPLCSPYGAHAIIKRTSSTDGILQKQQLLPADSAQVALGGLASSRCHAECCLSLFGRHELAALPAH